MTKKRCARCFKKNFSENRLCPKCTAQSSARIDLHPEGGSSLLSWQQLIFNQSGSNIRILLGLFIIFLLSIYLNIFWI
jgi:hypothetical protein